MKDDQTSSDEPASNRLAAFLRDCLLGLIVLAMIGWLVYFGMTAIATAHLDLGQSIRPSRRWFAHPLDGSAAVLGGISFLCLAAAFTSLCASHPFVRGRTPSWVRNSYWFLFAGWGIFYVMARVMS